VVVDRGAVSFNFLVDWLLKQMEPIQIHNGDPPNDDAQIMVTLWRMPRGINWAGLSLMPLLVQSTADPLKKPCSSLNFSRKSLAESFPRNSTIFHVRNWAKRLYLLRFCCILSIIQFT
jgi:hypothetical protein